MLRVPKRSRDPNHLPVVDLATEGQLEPKPAHTGKDPAAVALGRKGGLKGGKARAEKLSSERRTEIAKKAASKRWSKAR